MLSVNFEKANINVGKPEGWNDEDCSAVRAWQGFVTMPTGKKPHAFVVKWMPNKEEIEAIVNGSGIYVEMITTGLPPHSLHTTCPVPDEPVVLAPPSDWELPSELCGFIMEQVGAASMCWIDKPKGEFDIQAATGVGLNILNAVSAHVKAISK